jgi:DNA-binding transcriptional regulator/RsmH inhibitor MraZ
LEPTCYLALGRDKCVDVLTVDAFLSVANDAMEKVRRGEMDRKEQRALSSNMVEVSVDAQGRINVDEKLRAYAGLELNSRVIVSGSFDRVEIWDPQRHQRISDSGVQELAGNE